MYRVLIRSSMSDTFLSAALSLSLVLRGSIITPRQLTPLSLVLSLVLPAAVRRVEDDGSMDCVMT